MAGRVFPRDRVYIQRRVWIQSLTNVSSNSRRSPRRHSERLNIIFGILEKNLCSQLELREQDNEIIFLFLEDSPLPRRIFIAIFKRAGDVKGLSR